MANEAGPAFNLLAASARGAAGARPLVLVVDDFDDNYGLQQAREAGADAVLIKPCLPGDLLGVIGTLVDADVAR